MGGKRQSGRRGVQRFPWEFVSHLSDRPLASILATLSDCHCQVIISKALYHAHIRRWRLCVNEMKRKRDIVSSAFRACIFDSAQVWAFSGNLFIGPTSSLECVYLALLHVICSRMPSDPCQNTNLKEPPCHLLCANANVYISTFTAVSLFNSLSKGQTSRMWILCSFPLVSLKHLPSSLALSFSPSRSSSHLFFLCSSLTPSVCFLWSPVEVEKVNMSFSTITLLIVLSSLLFSDFFLFSHFCSCRFVIHPSLNLIMF